MSWKINPEWVAATHHLVFSAQFLPGGCYEGMTLEQALERLEKLYAEELTAVEAAQRLVNMSNINDEQIRADKQHAKLLVGNLQILKVLAPSRERSLAITKVQEAIMWLGMDLKRLGTPTPYPQSYNPESPVVEPTADNLKL